MHLSLGITTSSSVEKIAWLNSLAEERRLHGIWIGEDIDRLNDVFTMTSLTLLETTTPIVGVGITSLLIRNISTIARAALTLHELSPGRFRLGLGIGGLQDLAKKTSLFPAKALQEAVNLLRKIWSKKKVSSEGLFPLNGYEVRGVAEVPVFFGVRGPRLLKLAGELADGVILSGPKSYIKKAVGLVKEGLKKRHESSRKFTVVVWVPTVLVLRREDLALARETVAVVSADIPEKVLEMSNVNEEKVRAVREVLLKEGIRKASGLVTGELLEEFSVAGSASEVCQELRSFGKNGVEEVVFGPPYGADWKASITALSEAWEGRL